MAIMICPSLAQRRRVAEGAHRCKDTTESAVTGPLTLLPRSLLPHHLDGELRGAESTRAWLCTHRASGQEWPRLLMARVHILRDVEAEFIEVARWNEAR